MWLLKFHLLWSIIHYCQPLTVMLAPSLHRPCIVLALKLWITVTQGCWRIAMKLLDNSRDNKGSMISWHVLTHGCSIYHLQLTLALTLVFFPLSLQLKDWSAASCYSMPIFVWFLHCPLVWAATKMFVLRQDLAKLTVGETMNASGPLG